MVGSLGGTERTVDSLAGSGGTGEALAGTAGAVESLEGSGRTVELQAGSVRTVELLPCLGQKMEDCFQARPKQSPLESLAALDESLTVYPEGFPHQLWEEEK